MQSKTLFINSAAAEPIADTVPMFPARMPSHVVEAASSLPPPCPHAWTQYCSDLFAQSFRKREDTAHALSYAAEYCRGYDAIIARIGARSAGTRMDGICLCAFGSPARYEMLGQSDLDCLIVRRDSVNIQPFRDAFMQQLGTFGFCKLDIPQWGSLSDCKAFLRTAITEGNQIREARFIAGDVSVWEDLIALKHRYCTPERFKVVFFFQYFYFRQYYQQRERPGQHNFKYGHGGTRDFLFPVWLSHVRQGSVQAARVTRASVEEGILSLWRHRGIPDEFLQPTLRAASTVAFIRNELLRCSQGTSDSGLTYLRPDTAHAIAEEHPNLYSNAEDVLQQGMRAAELVFALKKRCFDALMRDPDVSERIVAQDPVDELGAISLCWSSNLRQISSATLEQLLDSRSWGVLTSVACNPTCRADALDCLATKGMEKGYEYVLKVVGRNPNTNANTLLRIAGASVEWRFREPADTRLRQGWTRANEL